MQTNTVTELTTKNHELMVLTDNSLVCSWMIDIIVSCRYWELDVLGDRNHLLLTLLDLVFLLGLGHGKRLGIDHTILLGGSHALFLQHVHSILSSLMLTLHHFL
jgi:hypothetical protein